MSPAGTHQLLCSEHLNVSPPHVALILVYCHLNLQRAAEHYEGLSRESTLPLYQQDVNWLTALQPR